MRRLRKLWKMKSVNVRFGYGFHNEPVMCNWLITSTQEVELMVTSFPELGLVSMTQEGNSSCFKKKNAVL